jgi:hypothetical protein
MNETDQITKEPEAGDGAGEAKPTHTKNPKRVAAGKRLQAMRATVKVTKTKAKHDSSAPKQRTSDDASGDGDGDAGTGVAESSPYATVMMGLAVIGVVIGIANVYLMVRPPVDRRGVTHTPVESPLPSRTTLVASPPPALASPSLSPAPIRGME